MGLFSSKKRITVSSKLYNLGGPVEQRPAFLKSVIAGSILNPAAQHTSISDNLANAMLTGSALKQRRFLRWASDHFPMGTPTVLIENQRRASNVAWQTLLENQIVVPSGSSLVSGSAEIASQDFEFWAERYVLDNRLADYHSAWTWDFDTSTQTLMVEFPEETPIAVPITDVDSAAFYAYVYYLIRTPGAVDPVTNVQAPTTDIPKLWIYKIGSGIPELDTVIDATTFEAEFYPVIPIRIDNTSIRAPAYQEALETIEGAWKRLHGNKSKLHDVIDRVEESESINDIDYGFITQGVSLNTPQRECKRYLYHFFKTLIDHQTTTYADFTNWLSSEEIGLPKPKSQLRFHINNSVLQDFDMRFEWLTIDESVHSGLAKPGAKIGDVWIEPEADLHYVQRITEQVKVNEGEGDYYYKDELVERSKSIPRIVVYFQSNANQYSKLTIFDLVHVNAIYRGKSVVISASQALSDDEDSGFFMPLHDPTLRSMSLLEQNEICGHTNLLILNSYKITKTKWYQSGIFKIFMVIAMIAIAIVMPFAMGGFGAMASTVGILGTNLAVGTAMGLAGTAAIIGGAIANAVAAMLVSFIITQASTMLFGEEIGMIIGMVASIVAMQAMIGFQTTGSITLQFDKLMRVDNLLKLTSAVVDSKTRALYDEVLDLHGDMLSAKEAYDTQMEKIQTRTQELLGYTGVQLDPLNSVGELHEFAPSAETMDGFLKRTLLTGSDIATITFNMISDFPRISLELPSYAR